VTAPQNWPALIGRLIEVRAEVDAADPQHLQPHTLPRVKASESEVADFEQEIGERVPAEYRDFLLHADGWPKLHFDVDLFGLPELRGGGSWNIGEQTLETYDNEGVLDDSGVGLTDIVPVGAGPGMSTVFAIVRNGLPQAGAVLWFSDGQEVERYQGFADFIASRIAYTERRLGKLRAG